MNYAIIIGSLAQGLKTVVGPFATEPAAHECLVAMMRRHRTAQEKVDRNDPLAVIYAERAASMTPEIVEIYPPPGAEKEQ